MKKSRAHTAVFGTEYRFFYDRLGNVWVSVDPFVADRSLQNGIDRLILRNDDGLLVPEDTIPKLILQAQAWAKKNRPSLGIAPKKRDLRKQRVTYNKKGEKVKLARNRATYDLTAYDLT